MPPFGPFAPSGGTSVTDTGVTGCVAFVTVAGAGMVAFAGRGVCVVPVAAMPDCVELPAASVALFAPIVVGVGSAVGVLIAGTVTRVAVLTAPTGVAGTSVNRANAVCCADGTPAAVGNPPRVGSTGAVTPLQAVSSNTRAQRRKGAKARRRTRHTRRARRTADTRSIGQRIGYSGWLGWSVW